MKNHLLSGLLLVPAIAFAQAPAPYVVTGKVGELNAPAKIYLVYGPQVLDSATLNNGQFELRGSNSWPHSAELVLERQGHLREGMRHGMYARTSPERVSLFLSPEPVTVASPDSLPKARLTGGPQLAAYQRLDAAMQPVYHKRKTAQAREATKAEYATLDTEYIQAAMAFVKANPGAWASLEILGQLQMIAPPQYAVVNPLYDAFSPEMRNSPPGRFYGKMLADLKAKSQPGKN